MSDYNTQVVVLLLRTLTEGLLQKQLSLLATPPAWYSSVCGVPDVYNTSGDGWRGQGGPPHIRSNHLPRATWYKRSMCESLI